METIPKLDLTAQYYESMPHRRVHAERLCLEVLAHRGILTPVTCMGQTSEPQTADSAYFFEVHDRSEIREHLMDPDTRRPVYLMVDIIGDDAKILTYSHRLPGEKISLLSFGRQNITSKFRKLFE